MLINSVLAFLKCASGVEGVNKHCEPRFPTRSNGSLCLNRRSLGLFLLGSSGTLSLSTEVAYGDVDVDVAEKFTEFKDGIHAYKFEYPVINPDSGSKIGWVVTRAPEKYSSAAPLAPDARAR